MLFNSLFFIFFFLPVTVGIYYLFQIKLGQRPALYWLGVTSLFFYGWWNPPYIVLLLFSVCFNYMISRWMTISTSCAKWILIFGITVDLGVIAYYKYFNFFLSSVNQILNVEFTLHAIIMPLGISFFTFQQIAFLVDTYKRRTQPGTMFHYSLFVIFFPQLIAGPIVHHNVMIPQISQKLDWKKWGENLAYGLTIFLIGLFKKSILADGIAMHASPVFAAAEQCLELSFFEAWGGAIAYTFQLYFDFSGYSEMAVGIAKMFGIVLPINFFSPYKARNIALFWQRWHITLSSFLKNYLYIPMGGNRKGQFNRYRNVMITMLLGGLWHGAGWTFIFWGGIHGLYLVIFNLYRILAPKCILNLLDNRVGTFASILLTFLSVTIAWVIFRAQSIEGAMSMYRSMIGVHGFSFPPQFEFLINPLQQIFPNIRFAVDGFGSFGRVRDILKLVGLFIVIWAAPNTFQLIQISHAGLHQGQMSIQTSFFTKRLKWNPSLPWAVLYGLTAVYCILSLTRVSEFLYFQF